MPRMPVTELNKQMAALEAKLNRSPETKGAKVMTDIDLAPNTYFLRRPSGIINLDVHTGGGLPAGGLTYLSGVDGAGKTFLLYKYVAQSQKLLGDRSSVALALSEAAPDHFFMRKCGMQIAIPEAMLEQRIEERKLRGQAPFTKEELKTFRAKTVGHVKILRGGHGEELLGGVLECFEKGIFDIIGLDSISAVLPEADANKDLDENQKRAAAAGLLTKFFQHYLSGTTGYLKMNPTTVIFISQVRSNSKKAEAPAHLQKYMPDYVAQGAWAAKHGKLVDILVKPGAKDREEVKIPSGAATLGDAAAAARTKRVQVGKTVNYEIMKGKAGVHEGITGEFDFNFPTEAEKHDLTHQFTDDQRMLVTTALRVGLASEKDGFITLIHPDNTPIEGLKDIAGIDRVADLLRADFELELTVRRAILSAAGVECAYR